MSQNFSEEFLVQVPNLHLTFHKQAKHLSPRSFDENSLRDSKTFGAFPKVEEACGHWLAERVRLGDQNCRRYASSGGHVHDCSVRAT